MRSLPAKQRIDPYSGFSSFALVLTPFNFPDYRQFPGQFPVQFPVKPFAPESEPVETTAVAVDDTCDCGHQLIILAAFLKELQTQAHLIHLNYTGSNFFSVHKFLGEQYQLHLEQFDTAAEFARALDVLIPPTAGALRSALPEFNESSDPDSQLQLLSYRSNLVMLQTIARSLAGSAEADGAIGAANFCAELEADAGKAAWFIKATTGEC
jgi:DNA-binding ferritin-like protein